MYSFIKKFLYSKTKLPIEHSSSCNKTALALVSILGKLIDHKRENFDNLDDFLMVSVYKTAFIVWILNFLNFSNT